MLRRPASPLPPHLFLPSLIQNNPPEPTIFGKDSFFLPQTPLIQAPNLAHTIVGLLEKEPTSASPDESAFTKATFSDFSTDSVSECSESRQIPSVENQLSDKDSSFVSTEKISTEELNHEFTTDSVLKSFELGFSPQPVVGSRPIKQNQSAYNDLMKHLSLKGNLKEVLRLFCEMKEFKIHPNVLCYNTVINALAKSGHIKEAHNLFDEMLHLGITPNLSTFNIFVKLRSFYPKQFDLAYSYIEKMIEFGFEPDSTTYSTLITGLCKTGRVEEAWGILDFMLTQNCTPTVCTFTPIVQAYCSQGKIEEAKNLMIKMENLGFPPNTITYNILINALCKISRFDQVEKLLEDSESKNWIPNSITYNTYMNGLCKLGMIKQALEKLEIMINKGLNPTNFTLGILLNCLCRDSRISEAQILLERSLSLNNEIGIVGYNTLMSRLCENGKSKVVLKLMTDMLKKGVKFDTRTLNIVINSLCLGGKFRVAKNLINCRGFNRNVVTYNTLIHWSFLEGRVSERRVLIYEMEMDGIAPDEITYGIMVEGYFREEKYTEAVCCFIESIEERGVVKDRAFVLLSRLVMNRRFKEMLSLFEGMKERGFKLDDVMFDVVIRVFCRHGFCVRAELDIVCFALEKMLVRI
ncbi:hypothetical protein LUZ60_004091 [Juncus effusus]|nr:hypothetical protein LUZ60_004091 [Juncus effusus]